MRPLTALNTSATNNVITAQSISSYSDVLLDIHSSLHSYIVSSKSLQSANSKLQSMAKTTCTTITIIKLKVSGAVPSGYSFFFHCFPQYPQVFCWITAQQCSCTHTFLFLWLWLYIYVLPRFLFASLFSFFKSLILTFLFSFHLCYLWIPSDIWFSEF